MGAQGRDEDKHREELLPQERLGNCLSVAGVGDGRSGSIGSHTKCCSKGPGDCSKTGSFSFGRLAVSYLYQM